MFWRSVRVILHPESTKPMFMLLLTVYRESAGEKEDREFARLQEAIEFGQHTGSDYEIYDPATGKVIDWNEINIREDDDWYYDENEYLWKRFKTDDYPEDSCHASNFHYEMIGQSCNLRHTGS
jgi:hypothetical protein